MLIHLPFGPLECISELVPLAMDRLRQAAQVGDTNELYKCIQEEVDVRRCVDDDDEADQLIDQAPLHITAIRGHVDFAMALMYLKPSWGRKLNQEVYSPMHLAVLNGQTELVVALLAVDKDLVRVKGRDGYTALHYAAETGNLELLAHFLKDCPACLEDLTIRNETALHVAAQNDRLEALEILSLYLRRTHLYCKVSKEHLLNSKDRNGNTVLHIAASNTQPQMIRLLLECQISKEEINKGGLTALELLETQNTDPHPPNARDRAAWNLKEMLCSERYPYIAFSDTRVEHLQERLRYKITYSEQIVMFLTGRIVNISTEKINALLVVLALILTATYQAMLSPPGGVWQGSYSANTTSVETHVGQSVMDPLFYSYFYALNLAVFILASILTVVLLQVVSTGNVVVLVIEMLLSLLVLCVLLVKLVIAPNNSSSLWKTDISEIQSYAALFTVFFIQMMETARRFFQLVLNPPPIKFFKRFFRDQM